MNRNFIPILLILLFALYGCACSSKKADVAEDVPQENTTTNQPSPLNDEVQMNDPIKDSAEMEKATDEIPFDGINTDWKYTNELMITDDDVHPLDKIDELNKNSGEERVQIYYQHKVSDMIDLDGIGSYLKEYGSKVTTFEILFPPEVMEKIKPDKQMRFMLPDTDTRLILTGMGEEPLKMKKSTIHVKAETLIIRNFRFEKQEFRNALNLDIGKLFIGENLIFNGNKYARKVAFMAKPLIILKSHADEGSYSQYLLKNVTFTNNATGLLAIDSDSIGKFDYIEMDHLTAKDNSGSIISISATKGVFVHDSEITGNMVAPLLRHTIPDPQVRIKNCIVSDKVYGYRPKKEYWHTEAKPLIKENLTEAEGTTYEHFTIP